MTSTGIVQKLWNYCNVLRDDGMSYGDYVEQLTYLLFLKMADERTQAPYHQPSMVPQQYSWSRKLPRQVDSSKVEDLAFSSASMGVIPPRLSWSRSSLYSSIQAQVISRTSSRSPNSQVSRTSVR